VLTQYFLYIEVRADKKEKNITTLLRISKNRNIRPMIELVIKEYKSLKKIING